jgi:hypothetical protein
MAVEIDTAADHVDLFDRLIAFLQNGSAGPAWDLLRLNSAGNSALFVAPGLSGLEQIHVGMSWHEDDSSDTFALGFWMFRDYNEDLGDLEQPGHSGVSYLPVWDTATPYWFVANAQRLIVTAKVSTVYTAAHAGKILPYGSPSEYPQPYYLGAPSTSATQRWSTTFENFRDFFDPGQACRLSLPTSVWWPVQNFTDVAGSESLLSSSIYVHPYSQTPRYQEQRENVDGSYSIFPTIVWGNSPANDVYGELDGVYAVTGFGSAAENLIEIDGVDYLVVQNVHRTQRWHYSAIRLI